MKVTLTATEQEVLRILSVPSVGPLELEDIRHWWSMSTDPQPALDRLCAYGFVTRRGKRIVKYNLSRTGRVITTQVESLEIKAIAQEARGAAPVRSRHSLAAGCTGWLLIAGIVIVIIALFR